MRLLLAFCLGTALVSLPTLGQVHAEKEPAPSGRNGPVAQPCAAPSRPDRLEDITHEGDLVLASRRLARIAGIRLPDDGSHRTAALSWLRRHKAQQVLVRGSPETDRWSRAILRLRLDDPENPLDLAHGLVEAGLAQVDPGLSETLCQPELLALEETARERRLGVWADERYKPLQVDELDRLKDRVGQFVLVQGRIRSVNERPQRTYLNFGGHWAEDFTIIVPRKTWRQMTERGSSAPALKGKRIRARGILQPWQGTALTIMIPEMIERIDDAPGPTSEHERHTARP